MKRLSVTTFLLLLAGLPLLNAQGTPAPAASDNPQAGLNLGASAQPAPLPDFIHRMASHLVVLDGDKVKPFDNAVLAGVKYWAFYYSASWCPPCRAFTPKLVDFYKSFKAQHPDFELIFVNDDTSADAMQAYMATDGMPWPAVRFDDIDDSGAKKYEGSGIPDLVLLDDTGKVLSDSFDSAGQYRGPQAVLEDIKQMVP